MIEILLGFALGGLLPTWLLRRWLNRRRRRVFIKQWRKNCRHWARVSPTRVASGRELLRGQH